MKESLSLDMWSCYIIQGLVLTSLAQAAWSFRCFCSNP